MRRDDERPLETSLHNRKEYDDSHIGDIFRFSPWAKISDPIGGLRKWHFSVIEPRDEHGRWTNGDGEALPPLVDVQYRGYFHDVVVDDILKGLQAQGSKVLKNVRVFGLDTIMAIPDGMSKPVGWTLPYFIEVKTGADPRFTPNQERVYPLICLGGHATSFDPRIGEFGLIAGAPFPPLRILLVYTTGPGMPLIFGDYCKILLDGTTHAP